MKKSHKTLLCILGFFTLLLVIKQQEDAEHEAEQKAEEVSNQLLKGSDCHIGDSWTIPYGNEDIKVTMKGLKVNPFTDSDKYNLIIEFNIMNNSDKEISVGIFQDFTILLFDSEEEVVKDMGIYEDGDWSTSSHYSDIGPMVEKTWQYGYFVTSGTYYVVISNEDPRSIFGRSFDTVNKLVKSGDAVISKIVIE